MTTSALSAPLRYGNSASRSIGWWAMIWTIATEASLFAYLIFSYFYLASQARGPWPSTGPLPLSFMIPGTCILVASSLTYWWGERGIRQGNVGRLRIGLFITFVLGIVFIILEGVDWNSQPFTAQSDAFGSLFYTVTGFHGAHVIVGLLLNLLVQAWAWRGDFGAERHLAVTNAGLYWHFVDIVWLLVFTTFYLTPRWG
jgi:heme/copper-type cytochrome/quinol oxidase subunit 3